MFVGKFSKLILLHQLYICFFFSLFFSLAHEAMNLPYRIFTKFTTLLCDVNNLRVKR